VTITTAQMRGARGLLNWSQSELSKRTGISTTSIGNIEAGNTQARETTLKVIRQAFENAGIEFIGYEGMRKRSDYITKLSGSEGFSDFLDDVYYTAIANGTKEKPTKVYLSNVVHENWVKWMGPEKWLNHTTRMTKDKSLMDVRIIVKEGDYNFPAKDYSQYKWFSEKVFNDQSFYSYHDRLAFLNFTNDDVEILIIKQMDFARGYRTLFEMAWNYGTMVPNEQLARAS